METLASILAGQGVNPYQQASQGIAPLLSQNLLNSQLAQGQLGQGPPQAAPPQQQGQGMPLGLGAMPAASAGAGLTGNPQVAALLQALQSGQNQGQ